tara:strand:+ start:160 stop:687 length:528 start_codon:yes stop_codon:yes gene_type:complete
MNNNVFNFQVLNNDRVDEVSDEMSCSTCDTDNDFSVIALSDCSNHIEQRQLTLSDLDSSINDKGPMTLAELECPSDDDDMLSEVSTVCYDETDHMEWDGSKTRGIGEVTPCFNSEDMNEAHRLGMSVCEMFEMYREINDHVDEDSYKNNCPPEWPLHLSGNGTYEDEGFGESYYG